jgi:hypothetical protein
MDIKPLIYRFALLGSMLFGALFASQQAEISRRPASDSIEIPYILIDALYLHTKQDASLPANFPLIDRRSKKIVFPIHPDARDKHNKLIERYGGIAGYLKVEKYKDKNKFLLRYNNEDHILHLTLDDPELLISDQKIRSNFSMNSLRAPENFHSPLTSFASYLDESENVALRKKSGKYLYQHGFLVQKRAHTKQQTPLSQVKKIHQWMEKTFQDSKKAQELFPITIEDKILKPYLDLAFQQGIVVKSKDLRVLIKKKSLNGLTLNNWHNQSVFPLLQWMAGHENTFLSGAIQKDYKLLPTVSSFIEQVLENLTQLKNQLMSKNNKISKNIKNQLLVAWDDSVTQYLKEYFALDQVNLNSKFLTQQMRHKIQGFLETNTQGKNITGDQKEMMDLILKHKIHDQQVAELFPYKALATEQYAWSPAGTLYQHNGKLQLAHYSAANEILDSKGIQNRFVLAAIDDIYAGQSFIGANSLEKSRLKFNPSNDYTFPVVKAGDAKRPYYMLIDGHHRVTYLHHYENYQEIFLVVVKDITHLSASKQKEYLQYRGYFWSPQNPQGKFQKIKIKDITLNPLRDLYDMDKNANSAAFYAYQGHERQTYKQIDYARQQFESGRDLSSLFDNYPTQISSLPLFRNCRELLLQLTAPTMIP